MRLRHSVRYLPIAALLCATACIGTNNISGSDLLAGESTAQNSGNGDPSHALQGNLWTAAPAPTPGPTVAAGPTPTPTPSPTPTETPGPSVAYALRGRFSPGASQLLAPQTMGWGDVAVVAHVTKTTHVSVHVASANGTCRYSLSAVNNSNTTAPVQSQTFVASSNVASLQGLDPKANYTVTFRKLDEAMYGTAQFTGFDLDAGALYYPAPKAPARRLEVFGDSISAGYGDLGDTATCVASADNEDSAQAYGPVAAAALGADLHNEAWSGLGIYENYGGSTAQPFPAIWKLADPTNSAASWDTGSWVPQVVVINLGTNDFSNSDLNQATFVQAYTNFLSEVRTAYPAAVIILSAGPMLGGTQLTDDVAYLQQAMNARAAAGDHAIYLLQYDPSVTMGLGCAYHPTVATHAAMAKALEDKINAVAHW